MNLRSRIIIKIVSVFLLLTLTNSTLSFGQVKSRDLLIGKWLFVKFEWPNYVPPNAKIITDSDKKFKDVVYIFKADNKFIMEKKGGSKEFNKQTTYVFTKDNKYVNLAVGQKMEIDYLDETTLKFHVQGFDPVGIFRRIK